MKRKIIAVFSAALVIIAGTITFTAARADGYTDMQRALGLDFSAADKVVVKSGVIGGQATIEGKSELNDFFSIFDGMKLKKYMVTGPSVGYIFSAGLFKSGKCLGSFEFGADTVEVPGVQKITEYKTNRNIDRKEQEEIARKFGLA